MLTNDACLSVGVHIGYRLYDAARYTTAQTSNATYNMGTIFIGNGRP